MPRFKSSTATFWVNFKHCGCSKRSIDPVSLAWVAVHSRMYKDERCSLWSLFNVHASRPPLRQCAKKSFPPFDDPLSLLRIIFQDGVKTSFVGFLCFVVAKSGCSPEHCGKCLWQHWQGLQQKRPSANHWTKIFCNDWHHGNVFDHDLIRFVTKLRLWTII